MCPGIEVTWSTRNPAIYAAPYRIKQAHDEAYYAQNGLSTTADECEGGGCEPGDLTKRMAIPWQADFFQCTAQFINFTDPTSQHAGGHPQAADLLRLLVAPTEPDVCHVADHDRGRASCRPASPPAFRSTLPAGSIRLPI